MDGNEIKVANGTDEPEFCDVSVDGSGIATITTYLSGDLTAVYPASAAKMNGKAIDGILVPTVQDGTFASANICKATIKEGDTEAVFYNQTAVFKITPDADATYVDVIAPHYKVLADYVPAGKVFDCDSYHKIHVSVTSTDPVYVSIQVPENLNLKSLNFVSNSGIKTLLSSDEVVSVNSLYTITSENWSSRSIHSYVEIDGLKWATMDVGATTVAGCRCTSYGDYFAWGETEPYYTSVDWRKSGTDIATFKETLNNKAKGYDWVNYKYCNGGSASLTKYNNNPDFGIVDDKTILDPEDDAATVNWGPTWHMPKPSDFQSLCDACNLTDGKPQELESSNPDGGVYWLQATQEYLPEYQGVAGILFVYNTDNSKRVFFPAAGLFEFQYYYGSNMDVARWFSTLLSNNQLVINLQANSSYVVWTQGNYRFYGFTVRPLSD